MRKNLLVLLFLCVATANAQWFTGAGTDGKTQAVNLYDRLLFNLSGVSLDSGTDNPQLTATLGGSGSMYFSSAGPFEKIDNGSSTLWAPVGQKFRSYNNFYTSGNADYGEVAGFNTGNNADFDGGGALSGTLAIQASSTSVIDGPRAYEFTQAAGSLNDYVASEDIDIPRGYRGGFVGMNTFYNYDGADSDMEFHAKCTAGASSGTEIKSGVFLPASNPTARKLKTAIFIPVGCESVRVGFSVAALNTGKILTWDEMQVSNKLPWGDSKIIEKQVIRYRDGTTGGGSTDTAIAEFNTLVENTGDSVVSVVNNATNGMTITCLKDVCMVDATWTGDYGAGTGGVRHGFSINSTQLTTAIQSITANDIVCLKATATSSIEDQGSCTMRMIKDDVLRPHSNPAAMQSGANSFIVIKAWASTQAYSFEGEGAENKYKTTFDATGAICSTILKKDVEWYDTTACTRNAAGDYTLNPKAGFFLDNPSVTVSVAEDNAGFAYVTSATSTAIGIKVEDDTGTAQDYDFTVNIGRQGTDYRPPHLSIITPIVQTCYIKDVKSSGTNGGTFTGGSWQTRDVNTLEGECGFVGINANVITVSPGQYRLEASSVAIDVRQNQLRWQNTSDATTEFLGIQNSASDGTSVGPAGESNMALMKGSFHYTIKKDFELQHRSTSTSGGTYGFGFAGSWGDEVYTIIKLERIGL